MKGKIILQDIDKPTKGTQVIWRDGIHHIDYIGSDGVGSVKWSDEPLHVSELKQIAVEYKEMEKLNEEHIYSGYFPSEITKTLPLHPDDWKVAIALIGHEIEFKTAVKYPGEGEKWAMLVLPTPVRTIEDIPEGLRQNYPADFNGNEYVEETWDDIFKKYADDPEKYGIFPWLKQHYHTPKKKLYV